MHVPAICFVVLENDPVTDIKRRERVVLSGGLWSGSDICVRRPARQSERAAVEFFCGRRCLSGKRGVKEGKEMEVEAACIFLLQKIFCALNTRFCKAVRSWIVGAGEAVYNIVSFAKRCKTTAELWSTVRHGNPTKAKAKENVRKFT